MKLIPFDPAKAVPGVTKLRSATAEWDVTYEAHFKDKVVYTHPSVGFVIQNQCNVQIIDETEPKLVPHTIETFPRDGWFRGQGGREYRITAIDDKGVVFCAAHHTFQDMLDKYPQVHRHADGTVTTSPCGREL